MNSRIFKFICHIGKCSSFLKICKTGFNSIKCNKRLPFKVFRSINRIRDIDSDHHELRTLYTQMVAHYVWANYIDKIER